ncbi:hypothetical protein [Oceanisphaera arctica]|uniref:hypothetical protein n=1 Tax=Oceanisphaera arctica TaxID=641510 RepID=UPI0011B09E1A|nr:hypothetical protein [Oceanisphaera arctica]
MAAIPPPQPLPCLPYKSAPYSVAAFVLALTAQPAPLAQRYFARGAALWVHGLALCDVCLSGGSHFIIVHGLPVPCSLLALALGGYLKAGNPALTCVVLRPVVMAGVMGSALLAHR